MEYTMAALDLAVSAAALSNQEARLVTGGGCGVMYPFGLDGDKSCPACDQPVYAHLGYPAPPTPAVETTVLVCTICAPAHTGVCPAYRTAGDQ
jgi:hypothetical protein